jgi:1,4-dihydroxy-2-naphthoate octaprenyltransferase
MDLRISRFFIQVSRPLNLLGGILVFTLGVGIARYLGNPIDWSILILGQIWILTYQLGSNFLTAYFHHETNPTNHNQIPIPERGAESTKWVQRDLILWAALAAFAAMASLTLVFIRTTMIDWSGLFVMGMLIFGAICFALPPISLITSGYGELVQSIIVANLIPAFAVILLNGELHRLVAMSTFPLTLLYLAKQLAVDFQNYSHNLRAGKKTLLVRLGWERGLTLHNLLILGGFLLFGVSMLFGLPVQVSSPVFFVFPLGLFQVWYMTRIASGVKPNWRVLCLTAILTFGLTTYLMALSFWIR